MMAFFETASLHRAWGAQHLPVSQPASNMPHLHVYSPFPVSDSRSRLNPIEFFSLILDPRFTKHLGAAVTKATRRAVQSFALDVKKESVDVSIRRKKARIFPPSSKKKMVSPLRAHVRSALAGG